jgi:undecaprenyl-diphosphatase
VTLLLVFALAALQGLTEFLPVSSSGHLALAQRLAGLREPPLAFNVSLHVGTLVAVVLFYRRDVRRVLAGAWRWTARAARERLRSAAPADQDEAEALGIVAATAVTGAVGLALLRPLEAAGSSPLALGALFAAAGVALGTTRWAPPGTAAVTVGRALVIGLAQAVAILPGVSRSGMTIAAALWLGVERAAAVRFAFLVSVPAVAGAEIVGSVADLSGEAVPLAHHVLGAAAAGVAGWGALGVLLRLVRRGGLHWFALYLVPLGIAAALLVR